MAILKIGIQTRSLRRPLKQALHIAAELGAEGVEIDARSEIVPAQLSQTGRRHLRKMLDDLNLRVAAIAFPTRRGFDRIEDLDRRLAATQAAMRFAAEMGARVVVNRVGQIPDSPEDARFGRLVDTLSVLGTFGQRVGARLAAQTAGTTSSRLAQLLEALPDGSIGIDLHPAGLILAGDDPLEAVRLLGPAIAHVHACDAVRDLGQSTGLEVQLGRGSADFPALLADLHQHDYRGWVTAERQETADPVEDLGDAVAYLRELA